MIEVPHSLINSAEFLHSRKDLYVVGPVSTLQTNVWDATDFRIFVAPYKPVHTVEALNELGLDLDPALDSFTFSRSSYRSSRIIALGRLNCAEVIPVTDNPQVEETDEVDLKEKTINGEIVIFPNSRVVDLFIFNLSARLLYKSVGGHFDSSYFGKSINQNFLAEDRINQAKFLLNGQKNLINEGLLTGEIEPSEITTMLVGFLRANARLSGNPEAMLEVENFVVTHLVF